MIKNKKGIAGLTLLVFFVLGVLAIIIIGSVGAFGSGIGIGEGLKSIPPPIWVIVIAIIIFKLLSNKK